MANPRKQAQAFAIAGKSRIPVELKRRPFSLEEARAAGLTLEKLRARSWRRLGRGLYCWARLVVDPWGLLAGWHRLLPGEVVFAGATAAWLLGLDLDPVNPVEVIAPSRSGVRSRPGLNVRHCELPRHDIVSVRGLPATSVHRTLTDICLRLPEVEALVVLDAAKRAGLRLIDGRLAGLAEPAESPMETRLRWLLLQAGLPRPEVQVRLCDAKGRFVGRADLYYASARLVIEYDGANHRERLVEDDRRQNLLVNAGYRLLRFTAADIHQRRELVAAQVRQALAAKLAS